MAFSRIEEEEMAKENDADERVLDYLQGTRKLAQRLDALDKMAAHENDCGERWRRRVIERVRDETLEALSESAAITASLGSVEGDVLTCLYVFGYTGKQTAEILGYSEERVWELARQGRKKLRGSIPSGKSVRG